MKTQTKNNKGFAWIIILPVVAAVLAAGGIWYYESHRSASGTQSTPSALGSQTSLEIVSPKAGDVWNRGDSTKGVQWNYPSAVLGKEVWMDASVVNPADTNPHDNLAEYTVRFTVPTSSDVGELNWDVFKSQAETALGGYSGNARIVLTMTDNVTNDNYHAATDVFMVSSSSATTSPITPVVITAPISGTTYNIGQTMNIVWHGSTHDTDICELWLVGPIDASGNVIQSLGAEIPIQGLLCKTGAFSWNVSSSYLRADYRYKLGLTTPYRQESQGEPLISIGSVRQDTQTHSNSQYGVSFNYPTTDTFMPDQDTSYGGNNFVNQNGTVVLGSVDIPRTTYPGTNFTGGTFVASVSPSITNNAACNQFSDVNRMPSQVSTITVNGVKYTMGTTGSAAAGSDSEYDYFHTYQNGFCYEFLLAVNTFNRDALDDPSSLQAFGDASHLQKYFLSSVSFSGPTAKPPLGNNNPAVISFTESSAVVHSGAPNSDITFSWVTQGVDYVQLAYSCADGLLVVNGATPQCKSLAGPASSPNYSPNGSRTIGFDNENRSSPVQSSIPVTMTLEPFVNGVAVPSLNKTLSLSVTPTNVFPNGVPTVNNKLTLNINGASFKPGSPVTITWTDSNDTNPNDLTPPDSCVDLYLVQDHGGGGETYLYQIVDSCVQPAMSGSYSWTVPGNYSGSGFHILGITPGLTANALSAPFMISTQ